MADYLADTNLLLRFIDSASPQHPIAKSAVTLLLAQGNEIYITAQNVLEFWSVATRPTTANGLGWSVSRTADECREILEQFPVLEDRPAILTESLALVEAHGISGRRAFDARLVAAMLVHGISYILSFNIDDFSGFPGIQVIDPGSVN